MILTWKTFAIVCPLLFLSGFVDSIGGGGALISLPAYMFARLPIHMAVATNKLSAACGTSVATYRFARSGLINLKISIPAVLCAIIGSSIGANLSLHIEERILRGLLFVVLPISAFFVLNRNLFHDERQESTQFTRKSYLTSAISALIIGIYDGMYGPGTGTFLIIAFTVFAKMSLASSNAQSKVINLTTNITSLTIFLINRQVLIPLGLAAAVCNMAGNYIGSGLALQNGVKIVRPIILTVLVLLFIKIATGY